MKFKSLKNNLIYKVVLLVAMSLLLGFFANPRFYADDPATSIPINNPSDLSTYSLEYYNGSHNPADTLIIGTNTAIIDENFIPLGTESRPFSGTIKIDTGFSSDVFVLFNSPLFDYVSTDTVITDLNDVPYSFKIVRAAERINDPGNDYTSLVQSNGALFANHVVAGSNSANWNISLLPHSSLSNPQTTEASSFEGVIGDIASGATVSVNFNNTSSLDVSANRNVGLICGTVNTGATLNVATSGSASGVSVSTTSGDCGGLVGVMNSGSTLKFNSVNNSGVTSVSSTDGRAGGIVGWCSEVTILFDGSVAQYGVSGTVSATMEAGGLFGYFKPVESTFNMSKYSITPGMDIASGNSNVSGGVIGFLESNLATFTFDGNKSGSQTINVVLSGGRNRGGVIGNYRTNSLNNTLNITNTRVVVSGNTTSTGGLLGTVFNQTGSDPAVPHPSYVSIYGNEVVSSGNGVYGGLVSNSGNSGPFIDVSGTNVVSGTNINAGVVGNMDTGVLRLQGTLDLSGATYVDWGSGKVVKERDKSLIYALGTGSSGWIIKRNTSSVEKNVNIIGWGDVLRVDGTNLVEGDLFTITNHSLTINQAYSTISTLTQFVLTALNIQLNDGENIGALNFTSGDSNTSVELLKSTITLGADIDLAGTGILGFTRDNGTPQVFTGTLAGGNHTISLATGELYGVNSSGVALVAPSFIDTYIDRHTNNGLFAAIGTGATISNLTIDGTFNTYVGVDNVDFGALATSCTGTVSLTNVTSSVDINLNITSSKTFSHGGLFAYVTGSATITIDGCSSTLTVVDSTPANRNSIYYLGGLIGKVNSDSNSNSQSITINNSSVCGIDYDRTNTYTGPTYFGGVIGYIDEGAGSNYQTRTITLSGVTVNTTVSNVKNGSNVPGAALGTKWLSATVSLSNVTVNANLGFVNTASSNYGGLVQTATGSWNVNGLTLSTGSYGIPNVAGSTFGFITNKTSTTNRALFLVVNDSNYNISSLSFPKNPTFTGFDEIVYDSRFEGNGITNNGNSVISIETSGNVISTSGSSFNTYLNQTAYGKTTGFINQYARYYYNLSNALANLSTPKKKFLIWSVGVYAHSSISSNFNVGTTTFSGDLDMTGLSYYPIDYSGSVTFSSTTTIKLDNILMEDNVKYAYYTAANDNNATRSTLSSSTQHYLMHTSLFRDFVGTLSISGTTIQGNVPRFSDGSVGFIVSGTFGNDNIDDSSLTINGLTLDGVYISSSGSHLTTTTYAPLLINNVGKKTALTITGVSQSTTAYSAYNTNSYYAASSLIGEVGYASATAISVNFDEIKLDGRRNAVSIDDLDTKYGTGKSIFSRSTLLNSFIYSTDGAGFYNFSIEDDWGNGTTKPRNVTYGKEITASLEKVGKQKKYEGSGYFVSPTTYQAGSEYDFSTSNNFLPYVYVSYNLSEYKHELQVNITNDTFIEGCGKYGDPYIVDGDQLAIISKIINGQPVGSTTKINLPSDVSSLNWTSTSYTKYKYSYGTPFTSSDGGSDVSLADAIKYLAGAYYVFNGEIILPDDYVSLGTTATDEYAFHGVIIGKDTNEKSAKIINLSTSPLVYTSVGCVLKDFTIQVGDTSNSVAVSLASPQASESFILSGGIASYGALIRQILGGDTIIDNVDVDFNNVTITLTGNDSTHFERLIPVGGYVGVLVNGGLIFRNMSSSYVGLTNSDFNKVNDSGYLYVNHIIGRVIAGYAFHETASTYNTTSAYVNNGDKNYVISDLSLSDSMMTVTLYQLKDNVATFNVGIPNGQAMFVLGAIINSGAASASYHASDTNAYQALSDFWQAYRAKTQCRSGATYSHVGVSGFASQSDYTDYANLYDSFRTGDAKNVPYIIRAYTEKSGTVYLARCLSGTASYTSRITLGGLCDVASGFRGIGSIYLDNDYTRLRVQYLNGNSKTITLHMKYLEYEHDDVKNSKYIAVQNSAGFGLFNSLKMSGASASNSIRNFTLSGSVYYDLYYVKTGYQSSYLFGPDSAVIRTAYDKFTRVRRITHLSVGGVIGLSRDKFWIQDVVFDDFDVDGAKYAGGYVGFLWQSSASTIKFVNKTTNPGYISVTGGLVAGGFVGRCYLANNLTIEGVATGTSISIKDISIKSTNPKEILDYKGNNEIGVGGLIGLYYSNRNGGSVIPVIDEIGVTDSDFAGFKNKRKLTISNISLTKNSTYGTIRVLNASAITSLVDDNYTSNCAGGFVGSISDTWFVMDNCTITDISITGTIAGGILGRASQQFIVSITNTIVDGNSKAATISGYFYAGGVIGLVDCHDVHYICVDTITVKDYNIETTMTTAVNCAAGGVFGLVNGSTSDGIDKDHENIEKTITNQYYAHPIAIQNAYIKNNLIITKYNDTSKSGTGGLIGAIANDLVKITGYNIYLDGNTLKHYEAGVVNDTYSTNSSSNRRIGELIGNNSNSSPIKYVGVSVSTTTYVGVLVGGNSSNGVDNLGSSTNPYYLTGEIVLANYSHVVTREDDSFDYIGDDDSNLDDCSTVASSSPYITTNPIYIIGGVDFTGDAFETSIADLAVKAIITAGASGMYGYNGTKYYSGSNGDTNFQAFDQSKLAMFRTEAASYSGVDFPVIIIENLTNEAINKLINSYIRIISNTDYDFGSDENYKYEVYIYNMVYENSAFTAHATGASLKRTGGSFGITQTSFDSGKNQFSLIDVRFLNPANTTQVAYHLYVPVFVKKVLTYQFDITMQSGTSYLESRYTTQYLDRTIENIGAPVTLFFKYTYSRTNAEWENAINGGEKVYRSYAKTLTVTKPNDNPILADFPADTVLVLVDRNRGGKPYYASITDALSGEVLNLSAFRENMTKSGDTLIFSGDYFTPLKFSEMLTLTATSDPSGTLVVTTGNDETVVIGSTKYRLATDLEKSDAGITKYTISVTGDPLDTIEESYYITILTESNDVNDELLLSFKFSSPTEFSEIDYPAKRSDEGSHPLVQLVMGKIFKHTGFTVASSADSLIMSSTNRELTISMSAQLGLNADLEDMKTNVQNYISSTDVFQSFLVYLNRKEGGNIVKAILGDPTGSGEYRIGANSPVSYTAGNIRVTNTHAEFVTSDLSDVFALGNDFTITASVTLTYDSSSKISTQFPGRNALQPDNGVTVSGASHLAFTSVSTTYSKNSIGADETPSKSYYSDTDPEVATLVVNPIGDKLGDYSPLGINALNNNDATEVDFDLLAVLDTTAIRELITGYTKATVSIRLFQKDADSGEYEDALTNIDDYLTIAFEGINDSPTLSLDGTQYHIDISASNLTDNEAEITIPVIHCRVVTGNSLEASGLYYSNYKLEITVVLKDSSNEPISASSANDYIIYTNAKIIPNYIG